MYAASFLPHSSLLTDRAEEAAAPARAVHLTRDASAARRTDAPAVDFKMLAQLELSPKLEKTKRKRPRVGDDGVQRASGKASNP